MSKRVLIITYYWPPAGGAGVQRWLKFVKYLPEYGWEPVVYTVKDGEFPALDPSLEKDIPPGITVIRRKIFEPYLFYKKFIGQKPEERINAGFLSQSEKPPRKEKIARWIRGNLFIPDARKFWIRPSVRFLGKYLHENPVDIIVSTGPPHSMHMIGSGLKKILNVPWVADFRDPWTNIDFYEDLLLTKKADNKHRQLEKMVIRNADAVVSVTRSMQQEFLEKGAKKSFYIPNGYDPDDIPAPPTQKPDRFRIVYTGSINEARNPEGLWQALSEMIKAGTLGDDLEIHFIGKADISVHNTLQKYDLEKRTRFFNYLPHTEVMKAEQSAAVLLLLINRTANAKGIITGKIFEYLAAGRPILALGPPDGEAAQILKETKAGIMVPPDDLPLIKKTVSDLYQSFREGELAIKPLHLESFSRKTQTQKIAEILTLCT